MKGYFGGGFTLPRDLFFMEARPSSFNALEGGSQLMAYVSPL
jgi:hypothetical protein